MTWRMPPAGCAPLRLGFAAAARFCWPPRPHPLSAACPDWPPALWPPSREGFCPCFFWRCCCIPCSSPCLFPPPTRRGSGPAPLCRTGVYALCRHPGVLWLSLFYFSLWLAAGSPELFAAFLVYTVLDVAYALFQDRWTFVRLFPDYREYRQETPFLLPTAASWRRCFHTLKKGGEAE